MTPQNEIRGFSQDEILKLAKDVGLPHWYQTDEIVNAELVLKFATGIESMVRNRLADELQRSCMTQDEIIEMAVQAGFHSWDEELQSPFVENANLFWLLEAFAKLVAAKAIEREREACCGNEVLNCAHIIATDMPHIVIEKYRTSIRARGEVQ